MGVGCPANIGPFDQDMISALKIPQRFPPIIPVQRNFRKKCVFFRVAACAAMATSGLCINVEVKRGPLVRIKQKMALKSATRMT